MSPHIRRVVVGLGVALVAVTLAGIVVVGGAPTVDFPSVAALLYPNTSRGLAFHCTGTLIQPNIVLTAAHCAQDGEPTQVFFQHAGFFQVAHFIPYTENPTPPTEEDIAIIVLTDTVTGITPAAINRAKAVPVGTESQAVGFGYHSQVTNPPGAPPTLITLPVDAQSGLKFRGRIRTVGCGADIGKSVVCMQYVPENFDDGSTCKGDSGGPLFAKISGTMVLAGVAIEGKTCAFTDTTEDVEVFAFRKWLDSQVRQYPAPAKVDDASRHPLDALANDEKRLPDPVVRDHFSALGTAPDAALEVTSGAALLRVAVNTTPPIPDIPSAAPLSLSVIQGGNAVACAPAQKFPAVICSFTHPVAGEWTFRTAGAPGQEYQLVASVF